MKVYIIVCNISFKVLLEQHTVGFYLVLILVKAYIIIPKKRSRSSANNEFYVYCMLKAEKKRNLKEKKREIFVLFVSQLISLESDIVIQRQWLFNNRY